MTETVVCIDRDGTLIYDDHYYLGRQEHWQSLVEILDGVVDGVQALDEHGCTTYMTTNQSGVAVEDFESLTEEKAEAVCEYVMECLSREGAPLDGYYLCPHVQPSYEEKHPDYDLNTDLVCDCDCIKPDTGMVENILSDIGIRREKADVVVVGDRASDVKTGLQAGGTGVLVPFENQEEETLKVERIDDDNAFIASGFEGAAEVILDHVV